MGFIGDAVGGVIGATTGAILDPFTNLIGDVTGSNQAAAAAQQAAQIQAAQSQAAIDEQRRQFDAIRGLLAPFTTTGTQALSGQAALLGLGGADQAAAYRGVEQSPEFQALFRQGEEAILQNAAATGGLRGGNIQRSLAEFRPQLLNQVVAERFNRLGGLTNTGLNAATGTGQFGSAASANIGNLLTQQGQALAGGTLAAGNRQAQIFGDVAGLVGGFAGLGGVPGVRGLF